MDETSRRRHHGHAEGLAGVEWHQEIEMAKSVGKKPASNTSSKDSRDEDRSVPNEVGGSISDRLVLPGRDIKAGVLEDKVEDNRLWVPTTRQIFSFMMPTLGMLLANPVLSMVDTSFVGRYNDKTALGALAPSTAACDQTIYLASFIAVATVCAHLPPPSSFPSPFLLFLFPPHACHSHPDFSVQFSKRQIGNPLDFDAADKPLRRRHG